MIEPVLISIPNSYKIHRDLFTTEQVKSECISQFHWLTR